MTTAGEPENSTSSRFARPSSSTGPSNPLGGTAPSGSPSSSGSGIDLNFIIGRAQKVLADPRGVWSEVESEALSPQDVFRKYLLVMAAIGPVATLIGMVVFGISVPFTNATYRWPLISGITTTILTFGVNLAGVGIAAFIIEKMGPNFGAAPSFAASFRLVAFALTPIYVGGLLSIYPPLGVLGILFALYTLYVFYIGFTPMTGVPNEKKLLYFIVTLVLTLISLFVVNLVAFAFSPSAMEPLADFTEQSGQLESDDASKIELPGGISIDPTKFEESMKKLEALVPKENS